MRAAWLVLLSFALSWAAFPPSARTAGMHKGGMDCPMMGGRGGMPGHMMGRGHWGHANHLLAFAKELDLTDEQIVKLVKMQGESDAKIAEAQHKVREADSALSKLVHEKKVDRKKTEEKVREIAKLDGDVEWLRISSMLDAHNVLNDSQKKKLGEMKGRKDCPNCEDEEE